MTQTEANGTLAVGDSPPRPPPLFYIWKLIPPWWRLWWQQARRPTSAMTWAERHCTKLRCFAELPPSRHYPDTRTDNGLTALHLAADPDLVEALVAAGAEIDIRNERGRTPLHQAAGFREASVVAALLDAGADPALEDNDGNRPENLVARNSKIDWDSDLVRRLRGGQDDHPQQQ